MEMKETIKKQYANLISNSCDFREFVKNMDKYTTDEIEIKYGLKTNIISYCSDLSKRQA